MAASSESGGLSETLQKVESSLLPSIESHITNESFSKKDDLDFLSVKNSLLASYLIDLTIYVRNRSNGAVDGKNLKRLKEMKVVIDKMRGLDKKLRYQIDKLMAAANTASSYAIGGDNAPEDPLLYRPDISALEDFSDGEGFGVGSSDDEDNVDDSENEDSEEDDDLAAARATLSMAKSSKNKKKSSEDENDDGIYKAPRQTSVPYTFDQEQKQKEKEKRNLKRMRATELAQTLRSQYGEAPDQEDMHGGGDFGKQREAARRFAEREAEKTRYEENTMTRFTVTRKEKKERNKIMRMESSNLTAVTDLGNLVRETSAFGRTDDHGDEDMPEAYQERGSGGKKRYDNGKRRREPENIDGMSRRRSSKAPKAKNSFQAALYAGGGSKKSKKASRR
jgi:U3 small nucleolar ribonucleoprotein protein LCP5